MQASERTAFRKQVTAIIESCMQLAGWPCVPYTRRSMRLFARDGDVTPFLLLSAIAGRNRGGYVIEGGIGILHRPFERQWTAATPDADDDGLTAYLHSANFRELIELADLDPQLSIETQVNLWCEAVVAILNSMPTTHAELSLAHKEKHLLAGSTLDRFLLRHRALPDRAGRETAFLQLLEGTTPESR
jgi:hypothetical protein